MTRESTVLYPSPGRCIYCGDGQAELSDEHIVPLALDGHWVIDDASCSECAKFTCRAETRCLNVWMKPARTRLKMASRRKRKTEFPLRFLSPEGGEREEIIPIDLYPASLMIVAPPPPVLLRHLYPVHMHDLALVWAHGDGDNLAKVRERTHAHEMIVFGGINQLAYARMMAKIAHSYAVTVLGLDGFIPLLSNLIRERTDDFSLYVGGHHTERPKPKLKHQIQLNRPILRGKEFAVVAIQLFAKFGAPVFQVVVGQIKRPLQDGWAIQKSPYA